LKRIRRFVAARTIRTVFNPDFACSWERPTAHDTAGETTRQANREWRSYRDVRQALQSGGHKGLITSRNPGDIEDFSAKIIEEVREGKHQRRAA
jgi:hypothetical protein